MAEFRWYGHNCFRIRSKEGTVLTDPPGKKTGYSIGGRPAADIVTLSREQSDHANLKAIKDDYALLTGPGEYEIHDIFIYGFRSYHRDRQDPERTYNTIFVFEMDGMRIAHLGDLGHRLTPELTDALDNIDVLLIPAGGGEGIITPEQAAKIVGTIEPNVVIPMQFATPKGDRDRAGVDELARHLSLDLPDPVDKIAVRSTDFDESMAFIVLSPAA